MNMISTFRSSKTADSPPAARPLLPILLAFFLLFSGTVRPVSAQPPLAESAAALPDHNFNFQLTDQMGGLFNAVTISGGYAYVGVGPRMYILDIGTNPGHITGGQFISPVLPGTVIDIEIRDPYAFIFTRTAFVILDISDPDNMSLESILPIEGIPEEMVVAGSYAYLGGSFGLKILDITDKTKPEEIASIEGFWTRGIKNQGDYLYVVSLSDFMVIDKSDVNNPHIESSLDVGGLDIEILGQWAYVVEQSFGMGKLYEINISNPAAPSIARDKALGGNYVKIYADKIYIGGSFEDGKVIKVLNTTSLDEVGWYGMKSGLTGLEVDGDYIYATSVDFGLTILEWEEGKLVDSGGGYMGDFYGLWGVSRTGTALFAASSYVGVTYFDISDPLHPELFHTEDTPGNAHNVTTAGTEYVYVADRHTGMRILRAGAPYGEAGFLESELEDDVDDIAIWRSGLISGQTIAYLGAGKHIYKANVTKSAEIKLLDGGEIDDCCINQFTLFSPNASTSYLYMSTTNGLTIVDVSGSSISTIGNYPTSWTSGVSVKMVGATVYAFLATYDGFEILDVTNPGNIVRVGFSPLLNARRVRILGDLAFVTSGQKIYAVNISRPAAPQIVGAYETGGNPIYLYPYRPSGSNDIFVYLSDTYNGLYTLKFQQNIYLPLIVR